MFDIHARSSLKPPDSAVHAYAWRTTAWNWAAAAGRARRGGGAERGHDGDAPPHFLANIPENSASGG